MTNDISKLMIELGESARLSAEYLARTPNQQRNEAISCIAQSIQKNTNKILKANAIDIEAAKEKGLPESMIDRLMLDKGRIDSMASSMNIITKIEDPINKITEEWSRPNGMIIQRVSVPLGVIGIIYESRPNVTIDAASLCLRSGNVSILRGGSECIETNRKLYECIQEALKDLQLNPYLVCFVEQTDRAYVQELLQAEGKVDVIIPRGGKSLIQTITDNSRVPTIKHLEGICHTIWDEGYPKEQAQSIIHNAKLRRPEICGATETLLIHSSHSAEDIAYVLDDLKSQGCEIIGCERLAQLYSIDRPAEEEDWSTEYLDKKISVKIVDNIEESVDHVNQYASGHTESCLTNNNQSIQYFFQNCKSAILMHNASTQFADGGEFGFGAEIGISTDKLHVRGPVGAKHLTTFKYQVTGDHTTRS